jgi:Raf kinase inhibitor-like YbhB/YbcL family protein
MALRKKTWLFVIAIVVLLVAARWIALWQRNADIAEGQTHPQFPLNSASFAEGGSIPTKFTCDGVNISPDVQLPTPPAGSTNFALVMDDPDAATGFIHWIVYRIPVDTRDIPEAASSQAKLPSRAAEGMNDFDNIGYGGPCPPGTKPHHYRFRLYALDINPSLARGATKKQLTDVIKGHILVEGQLTGLYTRMR